MLTRASWRILLGLLLLVVLTVWSGLLFTPDGNFHAYVLDVGQGDSILLRSPHGLDILIDGGPDDKVLEHLGRLLPPWDRTIELMVLTHPHADHVTGLVAVLKYYKVDEIWTTGADHNSTIYAQFSAILATNRLNYRIATAGTSRTLDNVVLTVLYPFQSLQGTHFTDANEGSIVLKASYQKFSILLPGDAEEAQQQEVINQKEDVSALILKVPHHGSDGADLDAFLRAVAPQVAIISVGKNNRYHHPHAETLTHYAALQIPLLRTDLDGTVEISSNGEAYWIKTGKGSTMRKMQGERYVRSQQMVTN